ncbi:MAG: hypothetical protein QM504_08160 [Pseudomonadota bacterium]
MKKIVSTQKAFKVIEEEMRNSVGKDGLAHTWHCNIACIYIDAAKEELIDTDIAVAIANDAATKFMKACFDVDTKA